MFIIFSLLVCATPTEVYFGVELGRACRSRWTRSRSTLLRGHAHTPVRRVVPRVVRRRSCEASSPPRRLTEISASAFTRLNIIASPATLSSCRNALRHEQSAGSHYTVVLYIESFRHRACGVSYCHSICCAVCPAWIRTLARRCVRPLAYRCPVKFAGLLFCMVYACMVCVECVICSVCSACRRYVEALSIV